MSANVGDASGSGKGTRRGRNAHYWIVPGFSVFMGLVFMTASWIGGHPMLGLVMLGIMVVFGGGLALSGRSSEFMHGLIAKGDERINSIDQRATAFAGTAVIFAILIASAVEFAHGKSGEPYTWLACVGGVSYISAAIVLRFRR